jgi:murein DD-endopeptidase MepM/ murein hydrolase activator NlpD
MFLTPLALEPISARRSRRLPIRRRWLGAVLGGATLALTIPLGLGPVTGGPAALDPLSGAVAGAVSSPAVVPSPTPLPVPATPAPSVPPRATDPDGPATIADRLPPPITSLTGYRWPITKGRISLPMKVIPGGEWTRDGVRLHDGVDMASFCGAPIGAAHEGVVLAAGRHFDDQLGWIGDLGPYYRLLDRRHSWNQLPIVVVIDDGNGYRSIYAHFRDITVRVGQKVRAGQLLGHEGATGHASGCHLHYGLFSPLETKVFGLRADIRRHMRLPAYEIARIDPLLVLPRGDVALRTRQIAKAIAAAKADAAR